MTVHKSKGLEFDKVYVLDVVEDNWQPRNISRKPPANLPLQPYGELFDDYVRLLYVAVTRARQSVIVSSYTSKEQGQTVLPSPLISNALSAREVTGNEVAPAREVLESALSWPRLQTSNERILLASRLEDFYLTSTGMLQFLNVAGAGPQIFLENQLLRLPGPSSTSLSYGIAIHAALQTGQQLVNDNLSVLPGVLERFEEAIKKQHMSADDFDRFLNFGQQMLTNLFTEKGFTLPKDGLAEITLNDIYIGEARIGGKLDHLLINDNKLLISDYKTGKPLNSFNTKDQTKVVKAWQHRTQLLFYTLLASGSTRFANVRHIESRMIYLEAETAREMYLGFVPSQEEIERVESLAVAIWKHVKELNLPDISKYSSNIIGITDFEDDLISGAI
jgi:DNA helicase-2/ATP-dependent DNA helicase PcrA